MGKCFGWRKTKKPALYRFQCLDRKFLLFSKNGNTESRELGAKNVSCVPFVDFIFFSCPCFLNSPNYSILTAMLWIY